MNTGTALTGYLFDVVTQYYEDDPSGITVVAKTPAGDTAGWLHALVVNEEESGEFDVYVYPEHRRQGLGAQMWRVLENDRPVMSFSHGPFISAEGQALAHKMVRENPRQHFLSGDNDYIDPNNWW